MGIARIIIVITATVILGLVVTVTFLSGFLLVFFSVHLSYVTEFRSQNSSPLHTLDFSRKEPLSLLGYLSLHLWAPLPGITPL